MWSISKISIYSISGLYEGHGLEDAAYLVVEAIVDDRAARSGRISFAKRQRDMVCRCLVE